MIHFISCNLTWSLTCFCTCSIPLSTRLFTFNVCKYSKLVAIISNQKWIKYVYTAGIVCNYYKVYLLQSCSSLSQVFLLSSPLSPPFTLSGSTTQIWSCLFALVGNEVVDQLVKFNQALADHSDTKEPHLMSHSTISEYALSLSACTLLPKL